MTKKADKESPAEILHERHQASAKAQHKLDKASGSKKNQKGAKGDLAYDRDRVQRTLDRYRDEMVVDAPASGTPEDQK
jgi:hypothetical protein